MPVFLLIKANWKADDIAAECTKKLFVKVGFLYQKNVPLALASQKCSTYILLQLIVQVTQLNGGGGGSVIIVKLYLFYQTKFKMYHHCLYNKKISLFPLFRLFHAIIVV